MQKLRRRIAQFERSLPPTRGDDVDDETMDRALAAVSAEDREILMQIGQGRQVAEGEQSNGWTDRELAALDGFGPIVERECRRAESRPLTMSARGLTGCDARRGLDDHRQIAAVHPIRFKHYRYSPEHSINDMFEIGRLASAS